ncbi:hypothetical protein C8R48DRAFT_719329 [Suillus tomentosus]|nr:hypothetical protein C8R48DRAFT_719329 [Suillus tomentosus]
MSREHTRTKMGPSRHVFIPLRSPPLPSCTPRYRGRSRSTCEPPSESNWRASKQLTRE